MDLNQRKKERHRFVPSRGGYGADSLRPQTSRNLPLALVIEATEVLEPFEWGGESTAQDLAGELADVWLFRPPLAGPDDVAVREVMLDKMQEDSRSMWPEG